MRVHPHDIGDGSASGDATYNSETTKTMEVHSSGKRFNLHEDDDRGTGTTRFSNVEERIGFRGLSEAEAKAQWKAYRDFFLKQGRE